MGGSVAYGSWGSLIDARTVEVWRLVDSPGAGGFAWFIHMKFSGISTAIIAAMYNQNPRPRPPRRDRPESLFSLLARSFFDGFDEEADELLG